MNACIARIIFFSLSSLQLVFMSIALFLDLIFSSCLKKVSSFFCSGKECLEIMQCCMKSNNGLLCALSFFEFACDDKYWMLLMNCLFLLDLILCLAECDLQGCSRSFCWLFSKPALLVTFNIMKPSQHL